MDVQTAVRADQRRGLVLPTGHVGERVWVLPRERHAARGCRLSLHQDRARGAVTAGLGLHRMSQKEDGGFYQLTGQEEDEKEKSQMAV